jgi:hypothetical protein
MSGTEHNWAFGCDKKDAEKDADIARLKNLITRLANALAECNPSNRILLEARDATKK